MRLTVGGMLIVIGIGVGVGFVVTDTSHLDGALEKVRGVVDQAGSLVGLFKSGESEKKEVYSPPPPVSNTNPDQVSPNVSVPNSTETLSSPQTNQSSAAVAAVPVVSVVPVATPKSVPTPKARATKLVRKARLHRAARRSGGAAKVSTAPTETKLALTRKPTRGKLKKAALKAGTQTPVAKDDVHTLLGTYVSMELVTGRAVQGILEGKSATHYTLNVPGLGPLQYPIENVKSVVPAQ